jgi:type IV secretory pathway VirJ component
MSAGFCPLLATPKQLCRGNGLREDHDWKQAGQRLLPGPRIDDPWIVLSSPTDSQCSLGSSDAFLKKVHAQVVPPPAAGQLQQAMAVFAERSRQAAASAAKDDSPLKDLPLTEVPARGKETNTLAVILSGSGGWVGLDPQMGKNFAQRGVPVVGISSLAYFWKARTPDSTSQDLARILDHYLAAWHKERAIVVGYSQGADIVPFMVSRLPAPLRSRVSLVALIGPDDAAEFRLHPDGWMSGTGPEPNPPVAPEVARLKGLKVICVYGNKEAGSICPQLDRNRVERFELTGGHSFGGDAPAMTDRFMTGAGLPAHGPGA